MTPGEIQAANAILAACYPRHHGASVSEFHRPSEDRIEVVGVVDLIDRTFWTKIQVTMTELEQ